MSNHPPPYGAPQPPPQPQGGYGPPAGYPPTGYAPGGYPQAGYGPAPGPPAKKGGRGCLIAVIIVTLILVGIGVAGLVALRWLGDKVEDTVGSVEPCPYVTAAEASEALGVDAEATLFTGLGRVLNITDVRVLPDKDSCILQQRGDTAGQETMPGLGRTVRYVGTDAARLYDQELTKARGVTEDRGGGVTVESEAYLNREVTGLGDRAFCVKSSGLLAGVLVLEGDTLVYVALSVAGAPPGLDLSDPDNARLSTDEPACEAAQVLARRILDRS